MSGKNQKTDRDGAAGRRTIWATSALAAGCLLFVAVKAASLDLTWDEAWTVLHYASAPAGALTFDYANNHPLNSLLIFVSTRLFGESEFTIRLPNVLAALLYVAATLRLVASVRVRLFALAICLIEPYLLDHFALARGYGLALACTQTALVRRFFTARDRSPVPAMLVLLAVASTAYLPGAVLLLAALADHAIAAARGREPWHAAATIASAAFAALPLAALAHLARNGSPLFGNTGSVFHALLEDGIAHMVVPASGERWFALGFLAAFGMLALLSCRRWTPRTVRLVAIAALTVGATWAAARFAGTPLPTARLLVPWVPLWTLPAISMADDLALPVAPAVVVAALLAVLAAPRLSTTRFIDWPQDAGLRTRLVRALVERHCVPPDLAARYGTRYYLARWRVPAPDCR